VATCNYYKSILNEPFQEWQLLICIFDYQKFDNKMTTSTIILTEEDYIQMELGSDIRHELINEILIDMPVDSPIHNYICQNFLILLRQLLKNTGYSVFMEDVKLKIPDEKKYFYPDIFITKEKFNPSTGYILHDAELIVEVLSPSTRLFDTVDKFIEYKKIPTLKYYLLAEPEKQYINCLFKNKEGVWESLIYTELDEKIELPAIENMLIHLKEIYQP
jgi:Uma2 family endonuclease